MGATPPKAATHYAVVAIGSGVGGSEDGVRRGPQLCWAASA
jgi:hypothetical protein